jgi:hypothetical protein
MALSIPDDLLSVNSEARIMRHCKYSETVHRGPNVACRSIERADLVALASQNESDVPWPAKTFKLYCHDGLLCEICDPSDFLYVPIVLNGHTKRSLRIFKYY